MVSYAQQLAMEACFSDYRSEENPSGNPFSRRDGCLKLFEQGPSAHHEPNVQHDEDNQLRTYASMVASLLF